MKRLERIVQINYFTRNNLRISPWLLKGWKLMRLFKTHKFFCKMMYAEAVTMKFY